ncbi:GAF domain-containing sensor histidine kinase [Mucilaginibacter sp. HC2]|uniref:sensor histidine kinase n=1 Tax=Mucilaginibacter inviolabilis TaxID=2714892 RepID=UPI00140DB299|nr:GAF domain-containing sensor histidine kinase [Mucilaginibacter inviolabilis]NHA03889.1 GAF domain-containing sensor histidine kinase [Mucilaginibacter inviolabilis]
MIKPPIPENENERLAALHTYNILDTLPEEGFDEITLIASEICQTPISLVSLIDSERQWFKSHKGLEVTETAKDYAFCAHAILEPDKVMVVNNALQDVRFADNPLVINQPEVIFYTGVPLVTPDGHALGTLCVIDNKPKELSANQIATLKALAGQVVAQLELRKKNRELNELSLELKRSNEYLERFAVMAAHDIRNPLTSILLTSKILKDRFKDSLDEKGNKFLDIINTSSYKLLALLENMLAYSKSNKMLSQNKEEVEILPLLDGLIKLINAPACFTISIPLIPVKIRTSVVAFEQIIINLLNNAIRYNNKPLGNVKIDYDENDHYYIFSITDNGIGIAPEHFEKIFESMYTLGNKDRFDRNGTGVGLCTVKNLVEALEGTISVNSVLNKFTTFTFTLKK